MYSLVFPRAQYHLCFSNMPLTNDKFTFGQLMTLHPHKNFPLSVRKQRVFAPPFCCTNHNCDASSLGFLRLQCTFFRFKRLCSYNHPHPYWSTSQYPSADPWTTRTYRHLRHLMNLRTNTAIIKRQCNIQQIVSPWITLVLSTLAKSPTATTSYSIFPICTIAHRRMTFFIFDNHYCFYTLTSFKYLSTTAFSYYIKSFDASCSFHFHGSKLLLCNWKFFISTHPYLYCNIPNKTLNISLTT